MKEKEEREKELIKIREEKTRLVEKDLLERRARDEEEKERLKDMKR